MLRSFRFFFFFVKNGRFLDFLEQSFSCLKLPTLTVCVIYCMFVLRVNTNKTQRRYSQSENPPLQMKTKKRQIFNNSSNDNKNFTNCGTISTGNVCVCVSVNVKYISQCDRRENWVWANRVAHTHVHTHVCCLKCHLRGKSRSFLKFDVYAESGNIQTPVVEVLKTTKGIISAQHQNGKRAIEKILFKRRKKNQNRKQISHPVLLFDRFSKCSLKINKTNHNKSALKISKQKKNIDNNIFSSVNKK